MKRSMRILVCVLLILTVAILPSVQTAFAASSCRIMKTNVDGARLRTAGIGGDIIYSMRKGTFVVCTGKTEGAFYQVLTPKGDSGWVYKPYLSAEATVKKSQVYCASSGAKVYKKPKTSASGVTRMAAGSLCVVFKTSGKWAYIRTLTGKKGFVLLSKLSRYW